MVDRLEYLARTLSRTNRKDYENYVLGAVWNRLSRETRAVIKPVSQQTVRTADGDLFYLDLFFPQLNIAVECDELFHAGQADADQLREDRVREVLGRVESPDLFATLSAVSVDACTILRVPVSAPPTSSTRSAGAVPQHVLTLAEFEATIDRRVEQIEEAAQEARARAGFIGWDELDAREQPHRFYATHDEFTVEDAVVFSGIREICNVLLGAGYPDDLWVSRGYFTPGSMAATRGSANDVSRVKLWCPQDVRVAGASGAWHNTLSSDGLVLTERDERSAEEQLKARSKREPLAHPRITFLKAKDPVTGKAGYRFVGVFELETQDAGIRTYHRTETRFALIRRAGRA